MELSYKELVQSNCKARDDNSRTFQETFKVPLHRFMHPLFGLDVVELDKFIQPQENESTYQAIERRYGSDAVKIVEAIMQTELGGL